MVVVAEMRLESISKQLISCVTNFFLLICTFNIIQVVDLQGIKNGEIFRLTDPVIHCKDVTRFGKTNFGEKGMQRFFETHRCNPICNAMQLPAYTGKRG